MEETDDLSHRMVMLVLLQLALSLLRSGRIGESVRPSQGTIHVTNRVRIDNCISRGRRHQRRVRNLRLIGTEEDKRKFGWKHRLIDDGFDKVTRDEVRIGVVQIRVSQIWRPLCDPFLLSLNSPIHYRFKAYFKKTPLKRG